MPIALVGHGVECGVGQALHLRGDGLDHLRVAMTQVEDTDAADEVDVLPALGVPHHGIAAMTEGDGVDDRKRRADGRARHLHATSPMALKTGFPIA
ncbi:hypothetical protein D9M71_754740 [compost metagenome]